MLKVRYMKKIIREVPNHFDLPYRLKRLADLAHNLWWVWNPEAARLFKDIDALGWDNCNHNPIVFCALWTKPRCKT